MHPTVASYLVADRHAELAAEAAAAHRAHLAHDATSATPGATVPAGAGTILAKVVSALHRHPVATAH
jgi:hypothetical protein